MKKTVVYRAAYDLSYSECGNGEGYPVLVQHGMVASIDDHDLFERLVELGARVISIARPGYGESSPYLMANVGEWGDIVSVLVRELGLSGFYVLGMSSGAPYSYAIGHRLPGEVRNIFIFSGVPALYDEVVQAHWPYETTNASMAEMQQLAHSLFFSGVTEEDLERNDIRDSIKNDCFGIAQDLKLRSADWGFLLSDVKADVYMRHSKTDEQIPIVTAVRTSELLSSCSLDQVECGPHFSEEALSDFIEREMAKHYMHER